MHLINHCKMLIEVMEKGLPKYALRANGDKAIEMCKMMNILPATLLELAPNETLTISTHVPNSRTKMACLNGLLTGDMPPIRVTVEALDIPHPEEDICEDEGDGVSRISIEAILTIKKFLE